MNGWTPSTSLETRVSNLFAQIPVEYRASASLKCYGEDDHDFERKLTAYVLGRVWEHPADVAAALEAQYEKPQADEADWFTKPDSIISRNHLPETNANGNLQWQGVEFYMPAIVERTQTRSAELKAQIEARTAAVKSLNSQAVKNVRLGGA